MSVEWTPSALDEWANIYVAATSAEREVLEQAYHDLNARLDDGPQFLGESRRDNERAWFFHPFAVRFTMIPHGPVQITHIRRLRGPVTPPPDDEPDT